MSAARTPAQACAAIFARGSLPAQVVSRRTIFAARIFAGDVLRWMGSGYIGRDGSIALPHAVATGLQRGDFLEVML